MSATPLIQAAVKQAVGESRGHALDAGQRVKQWFAAQMTNPTPALIEEIALLTPTSLSAGGVFRDSLLEAGGDPELAFRIFGERVDRRENPTAFAETVAAMMAAANRALAELISLEAKRWRIEHGQDA